MKKLPLLFALIIFSSPVLAADDKAEPVKNEVAAAAEEFMKDLNEANQRHFSVLHSNYNMIKVVETVRESVDEAVDACGDANPDMEDALETRFGEWKAAVSPVIKEADANVDNMIVAQEYAKPKEIQKFLKLIDKVRKEQGKLVKRNPVVSAEACQSLLEKMNGTQENMVKLLQSTLVTLPQVMQMMDDAERAKADAKAREQAEKEQAEAEKKAAKEAEKKGQEEAEAKAKEEAAKEAEEKDDD